MMFWDRPEYKAYEPQTFKETVTTVTYTPQFKELTDEEILEICNQFEEGVAFSDIGWSIPSEEYLDFARAILRKAQER